MNTESTRQSVRFGWQDRQVWVAWLCVAGQLLTTQALIKLALLALAAVLLVSHVQRRGFLLARSSMILGGAVLFGVCYLACPYWTITTLPEAVGPWVALFGLVILGALWCWCFAQPVEQAPGGPVPLPAALLCVVAVLALLVGGLFAPLEWRGDEDTHLARLWALTDSWRTMPLGWALPLSVVLCSAALWNPGRRISLSLRCVMVFGSLAVVTWSMGQANDAGQLDHMLRRYPAGLLWLQAAVTLSVRGWTGALAGGPELARLLPLLSLVSMVLCWTTRCRSDDLGPHRLGVFGEVLPVLALATVPVLQCYGAGIYLEMPLMLLMLWVCGDAHRLFGDHLRGDTVRASWLALAAIPFIKETSLVFCLAVMAFAALLALRIGSKGLVSWGALAVRYLRLGVVALLPVGVFLYFRMQGPEVRFPYHFYLPNFVEPTLYRIVGQALWQQYGLLLVLAAVGLACTLRRRPGQAVFCLIVLVGYFLFFSGEASKRVQVDGVSLPGYLGHARFMLYLLPPLLTLAWNAVVMLGKSRPVLLGGVMAICLAGNLWMSPLRADGTRVAGWGDTLIDTQGHHYPYPQLYAWFAATVGEGEATVAIVGRRYAYDIGDKMYARRFGLKLEITAYQVEGDAKLRVAEALMTLDELASQFAEAAVAEPDYIVIHQPVWGPRWDDRPTVGKYHLAETVGRFEHRLIVYRRRNS